MLLSLVALAFIAPVLAPPPATAPRQLCVHRYLDPRNGRWTQRDPLGDGDGQNRYAYVRNMPLVAVDPVGQQLRIIGSGNARNAFADAIGRIIGGTLIVDSSQQSSETAAYYKIGVIDQRTSQGLFDARNALAEIVADHDVVTLQWAPSNPNDYDAQTVDLKGGGYFKGGNLVIGQNPDVYHGYCVRDTPTDLRLAGGQRNVKHTLETLLIHELIGHGLFWVRGGFGGDLASEHEAIIDQTTHMNWNVRRPREAGGSN